MQNVKQQIRLSFSYEFVKTLIASLRLMPDYQGKAKMLLCLFHSPNQTSLLLEIKANAEYNAESAGSNGRGIR